MKAFFIRLGAALLFVGGFISAGAWMAPAPAVAALPPFYQEVLRQSDVPGGSNAPFSAAWYNTANTTGGYCFGGAPGTGSCFSFDGSDLKWKGGGTTFWTTNNGTGILSETFGFTTAGAYTSTVATGSNAFAVGTNGARIDFGTGANDYASSDGSTITFGTSLNAPSLTTTSSLVVSNNTLTLSGASGTIYFSNSAATAGRIYGHMAAANATATNPAVTITTDQALDALDAVLSVKTVNEGAGLFYVNYTGDTFAANSVQLGAPGSALKVPVVHGTATAQQAIEAGRAAMTAGALAVTFTTAFASAPVCTCTTEAAIACTISVAANTTGVTFAAAAGGTNFVDYHCIGAN